MKKVLALAMVATLTLALLPAAPAQAHHNYFWGGLAVGLGSAFLLGNIFYPPRAFYNPPPAYYNPGPSYYYPPPPYYNPTPTYYYAPPSGQLGYPPASSP